MSKPKVYLKLMFFYFGTILLRYSYNFCRTYWFMVFELIKRVNESIINSCFIKFNNLFNLL